MSNRIVMIAAATAFAGYVASSLLITGAVAQEHAASVYGAKTIGAMAREASGRAVSSRDVLRQGGLVTAGAASWSKAPVESPRAELPAAHGVGTVGAMVRETRGRAVSTRDVLRQGGFVTAGAASWSKAPVASPRAELPAAHGVGSIGAMVRETGGRATSLSDVRRQGGFASGVAFN